ncbi:HNH endonuclease signature motif containing protein [Streptomyces syringium]|uniref:HNH endonuclease signature motif containing protein n=2 Tax=Streptomyces syringium TaxID=76729 RepID=UPI00367DB9D9
MLDYMGVLPYGSAYGHIGRKLDRYGIDTSHFTGRRVSDGRPLLPERALRFAVAESVSLAGVLRLLGRTDNGASRSLVKRSIAAYSISTSHLVGQGHQRGRPSRNRRTAADILRQLAPGASRTSTALLRRALDDIAMPRVCSACGIGETWQGKRLVLEIDHINGDRLDNRADNLRYLCPSCHSQTRTFSNRSPRMTIPSQARGGAQYSGGHGSVPQLAKRAPV